MPVLNDSPNTPPSDYLRDDLRAEIVEAAKSLEDKLYAAMNVLSKAHETRVDAERAAAYARAREDDARKEYELIVQHTAGFAHGAIDALAQKKYNSLTFQIAKRVDDEVARRVSERERKPTIIHTPEGDTEV